MSSEQYGIETIPVTTEIQETRGSREKFWIPRIDEPNLWLLKFPRPHTGEHWAEKVAYEVAQLIGVKCARVELVLCDERYATICESFDSSIWYDYWGKFGESPDRDAYLNATEVLPIGSLLTDSRRIGMASEIFDTIFLPGFAVLATSLEGYDTSREMRFSQRQHNVENVANAIKGLVRNQQLGFVEYERALMAEMVSYVILDGLIGNTDRHHENWMLKLEYRARGPRIAAAPSFDHASSLGRELKDDVRSARLDADNVLRYLKRGRGGVYWVADDKNAPAPIDLARSVTRSWPDFAVPTLESLSKVQDSAFRTIVDRVPDVMMSEVAKDFAHQVLVTSKAELLRNT